MSIKLPSPSHAHVRTLSCVRLLRIDELIGRLEQVKLGSMVNALKHDFTLLVSLGDKLQQAESNAFSYGLLEASENNDEYAAALVLYPSELFPASAVSSKVTEEEESEDEATAEDKIDDEEKEGGDEEAAKEETAPETEKTARRSPTLPAIMRNAHLFCCSQKGEAFHHRFAIGLGRSTCEGAYQEHSHPKLHILLARRTVPLFRPP